jgi:hypothetical protein
VSEDPRYVADADEDWPPREETNATPNVTPKKPRPPRVELVNFLGSLTPQEAQQWLEHGHIRPLKGEGAS